MGDIRERLQEVFRDIFGDDEIILTDKLTADDIDGWDSLQHINLIIAIEKRFNVKFATAEISNLKDSDQNVGNLIRHIEKKIQS